MLSVYDFTNTLLINNFFQSTVLLCMSIKILKHICLVYRNKHSIGIRMVKSNMFLRVLGQANLKAFNCEFNWKWKCLLNPYIAVKLNPILTKAFKFVFKRSKKALSNSLPSIISYLYLNGALNQKNCSWMISYLTMRQASTPCHHFNISRTSSDMWHFKGE